MAGLAELLRTTLLAAVAAFAVAVDARACAVPQQPFGPRSAWNIDLPAQTVFSEVAGLGDLPIGLSSWLRPDGVSIPVSCAEATDPAASVLYRPDTWAQLWQGAWATVANPPAIESAIRAGAAAAFPYPYHPYVSQSDKAFLLPADYDHSETATDGHALQVRLPADARPTGNADGHLVVGQPDGKVFEAYASVVLSDPASDPHPAVVALTYKMTDPGLAGDGFQNGVTASMIPVYAGLIRASDLASGQIAHAMKIVAPPSLLQAAFVYPALSFDRGAATENPPYSGSLPMGARLAIPPEVDLDVLALRTRLGRMIAEAAATHGMIVVDRGGAGLTLIAEANLPPDYAWSPAAQSDLQAIESELQRADVPPFAYATSRAMGDGR